jgi:hypothetical protein
MTWRWPSPESSAGPSKRAWKISVSTSAARRRPSAYARPTRDIHRLSRIPVEIPIWRTGTTSSSSSRIGSSGDVQANPIDSSVSRSTSRGTPVSPLTCR